jgi:hypothetical protein
MALTIALLLGAPLVTLEAVAADDKPAAGTAKKHDLGALGQKLANPASDIWALFTEFDFIFNGGTATGGSGDKTQQSILFQPVLPIPIFGSLKMITRPSLPIIMNADIPQFAANGTPTGFNNFGGLGDLFIPFMFVPKPIKVGKKSGIELGLGPSVVFPTSTSDEFGDQQYQVGVSGLFVYKTPKITAGIFPQWWWGVGYRKSSKPDFSFQESFASHGELLYFFYYELGNAWQVGFNPVITIDYKASSGNQWNVPIGILFAKTTMLGSLPVKIQLGIEYSVVAQDFYGKRAMIKLNIIPVVPGLIQKPLFGGS